MEAEQAARDMLKNQGGGELTTKRRDGNIQSIYTISPGKNPNPPKNTGNYSDSIYLPGSSILAVTDRYPRKVDKSIPYKINLIR